MKVPFVVGRAIFGGFFLYNAVHHFKEYKSMAQFAKTKGVPMPEAAVLSSGVALAIGGTSILLGAKPKIGALAILGFLSAVSPTMHDFWNAKDENQKQNDMINFFKNVALAGGALALMGVEEPWPVSVETEDEEEEEVSAEERPMRLSQRRAMERKAA